jgi:nucleotide-binding universal stress UspA family protein
MFHKIVVAYNGSQSARHALDVAIRLTRDVRGELWALAVEEDLPHYAATIGETEEAKTRADQTFHALLSAAYLHALQEGVELKWEIRAGPAPRTIPMFVEEGQFDLLILGKGKHTPFLRTKAEKVYRAVSCQVLFVK